MKYSAGLTNQNQYRWHRLFIYRDKKQKAQIKPGEKREGGVSSEAQCELTKSKLL